LFDVNWIKKNIIILWYNINSDLSNISQPKGSKLVIQSFTDF